MNKLLVSVGLIAILGAAPAYAAPAPQAAAKPGWIVTQKGSMPVGGASTITFCADGVCIGSKASGLYLVAKSPDWDITLFSTKNHACFKSTLKNWADSIRKRTKAAGGGPFDGAAWKPAGPGVKVAGFQTDSYVTETNGIRKMTCSRQGTSQPTKLPTARLYVAKDIATPPQVSAIVAQLYAIPNCQKLPLKLDFTLPGRRTITRVDTLQIAKQSIPPSTFAVPTGLKLVKSDMDVFIDQKSKDELDKELEGL